MKVTPLNRKFGSYKPGDVFEFPDKAARIFIKLGKLEEATATPGKVVEEPKGMHYENRMMAAETPAAAAGAPYGLKADGTPRARPGRPPASAAE